MPTARLRSALLLLLRDALHVRPRYEGKPILRTGARFVCVDTPVIKLHFARAVDLIADNRIDVQVVVSLVKTKIVDEVVRHALILPTHGRKSIRRCAARKASPRGTSATSPNSTPNAARANSTSATRANI